MFKKLLHNLKRRPFLFGGIAVIVIIVIGVIIFRNGSSSINTLVVSRGEFISEVTASGKVVASQSSNLGFDQSGRVSAIYKQAGDTVTTGTIIASIDNGAARADVAQKQAALERERAKLAALERGTRSEQLALTEQKYADASSALTIAMRNAYLEAESSIVNGTDSVFENGTSINPNIKIHTPDQKTEWAIEAERITVGEKLSSWKSAIATLTVSSPTSAITTARTTQAAALDAIQHFIDHLSAITAVLLTNTSGLTQTEIDTVRTTVNTAGQNISAARKNEQDAYAAWAVATNNLTLDKSGSTAEDIAAQRAQVRAAEADLANAQAQLKKTLITAPFDGIVSRMDLKVGQIVSPNSSDAAMQGVGAFEIESYVPEVSISRVAVGNPATITLDAYGTDTVFPATVMTIDPAETIRDGVSTYKVRLKFSTEDPRIKSGMTANIRITSERKSNVIVIPKRVITDKNGVKTVQIKSGESITDVTVETGNISALGQVEITSGLSDGDTIVIPSTAQ